jgi:hypothetical protein
MRNLLLAGLLLLTGCATSVPVTMSFPQVPEALEKPCERMEPLAADKKELSDLLENTTDNYAKAKECNAKVNAWQEWYETQKKIFEEVK